MTPQIDELKTYQLEGQRIELLTAPDVWSPYSAKEMITFLTEYGYLESITGAKVLDLGTGSGIIGIFAGKLGAREVVLTDYCPSAVRLAVENAQHNGIMAHGIQSDCFKSLKGQKFDFIISNPPVQPWLFTDLEHPESRQDSAMWNEAGSDGRLVLDSLIAQSKYYLEKGGTLITSCSTRHGHKRTEALLNDYWEGTWQQIYATEHAIDMSYHKPYLPIWLKLQSIDHDLRIYQKDEQGRVYASQTTQDGKKMLIAQWENDKITYKFILENGVWTAYNTLQHALFEVSAQDTRLPTHDTQATWYYQYILLRATK